MTKFTIIRLPATGEGFTPEEMNTATSFAVFKLRNEIGAGTHDLILRKLLELECFGNDLNLTVRELIDKLNR